MTLVMGIRRKDKNHTESDSSDSKQRGIREIKIMRLAHYCFLSLFLVCLFGKGSGLAQEDCQSCHKTFQSSCGLSCTDCHNSPNADFLPAEKDHPRVIRNPSRPRWWAEKCVFCHQKEIENFRYDPHYANEDIIRQTRFLWGKTAVLKQESVPDEWKQLRAEGKTKGHSPADLVDNLLAKKCMACHFDAPGKKNGSGRRRPAGCAACHVPLEQTTGKPLKGHRFQKKPDDTVCLTCHSGNRIGADYYGWFEHDYHKEYATPYGARPRFGAYQHRLAADVHQKAGMRCLDCHTMNRHTDHSASVKQCEDCHGGFYRPVAKKNAQTPLFKNSVIAHKDFHRQVSCSACHAQWSYQDYGLHLFLDESNHYDMWQTVRWQGDAVVTDWLDSVAVQQSEPLPNARSLNRLTGKISPGIWYQGWTFRRWDEPVLGVGRDGRFYIIRPMYQYYVTYVDSADNLWLDSVIPEKQDATPGWSWDVYVPHTVGKTGRACESCHGNAKAAGLGIRQSIVDSAAHFITLPSPPIEDSIRLLTPDEQKRLLIKSKEYKKERSRAFRRQGIEQLFK